MLDRAQPSLSRPLSRQHFPSRFKLNQPFEYAQVFAAPTRIGSRALQLLARPSQNQKQARLGIIIAKRQIKQAVQRNRLKRWLREWFRKHHQTWALADHVFVVKASAISLSFEQFTQLVERLCQRYKQQSLRD